MKRSMIIAALVVLVATVGMTEDARMIIRRGETATVHCQGLDGQVSVSNWKHLW